MAQEKAFVTAFKNLILLGVIIYSGWTVGFSIYRNYQINRQVAELKVNIEKLKQGNTKLENLSLFYQTTTYADIEARKRLNLKRIDEKVFSVNLDELKQKSQLIAQVDINNKPTASTIDEDPIPYKWYQYISSGML